MCGYSVLFHVFVLFHFVGGTILRSVPFCLIVSALRSFVLFFSSLPPSLPWPLWNSYPTQPDPTIFISISYPSDPYNHPRKHPDQSFLALRSDPRSSSSCRIRFQSLDLARVVFPPVIAVFRLFSTHTLASQVDESGHLHPPATNAFLTSLRIENSGSAALPCIRP